MKNVVPMLLQSVSVGYNIVFEITF